MDLRRTKSKYTPEQRLAIIEEYEKGALSGKEITEKDGIKYPSQILNWRKRLLKKQYNLCKSGKMRTFYNRQNSHCIFCTNLFFIAPGFEGIRLNLNNQGH